MAELVRVAHDAHGLDPAADDVHREHAPDPELAALVRASRDAVPPQSPEVVVWSVLTVDVVEGRIQTVRIVRNPDKLRHL